MGPGLLEGWYPLPTSSLFRVPRVLFAVGGDAVDVSWKWRRKERMEGRRRLAHIWPRTVRDHLAQKLFFTEGETEAKGQRLDTKSAGGVSLDSDS